VARNIKIFKYLVYSQGLKIKTNLDKERVNKILREILVIKIYENINFI
jgi:hypothetical protein